MLYQLNTMDLYRLSKKSCNALVTVLIALYFNVFQLAQSKYTKVCITSQNDRCFGENLVTSRRILQIQSIVLIHLLVF